MASWVDLVMSLCLSVCLHIREHGLSLWHSNLKIFTPPLLPKKLLICRNGRYRTTISYSCITNWTIKLKSLHGNLTYLTSHFYPKQRYNIQNNSSNWTTIAYSYNTNKTIKIKFLYGKLLCLTSNLFEICHKLFSKTTLQSPNILLP